jgi:hemolysin III
MDPVEDYFRLCKRLCVAPDPSFLISIRAGLPDVKFTRRLGEADLLALYDFLVPLAGDGTGKDKGTPPPSSAAAAGVHIPKVWDFSNSALGSNGAALVARMLRAGLPIQRMSLANCGIGPRGFHALADTIAEGVTPTLRALDLSGNLAHMQAARELARAVEYGNHSLEVLDMGCCHATFEGVVALSRAVTSLNTRRRSAGASSDVAPLEISTYGNLVREEVWNSITHGIGLVLAIVGGAALLLRHTGKDTLHTVSAVVFVVSLLMVYAASFFYHSFFKVLVAKRIFHRLDHLAIYFLIAGSYTPFSLLSMHGTVGWVLFAFVWGLAVVGICLDLFAFTKYHTLKLTIYLAMGWACMLVTVPYLTHPAMVLVGPPLYWLAAGGLFYTTGVVFFVLEDSRTPSWHILWHVFVCLGSACHWISLHYYVFDAPLPSPPVNQWIY